MRPVSLRSLLCRIVFLAVAASASILALDVWRGASAQNDIMQIIRRDWERKQELQRAVPRATRVPARVAQPRRTRPRASPFAAPRPTPATVAAPKVVVVPTIFVKVLGNSLAEMLADGLAAQFADRPDIAVKSQTKPSSGLVRDDYFDWPKAAADLVASGEQLDAVVIMLGANDRQALRIGEDSFDIRSDEWREAYVKRTDAMLAPFKAKGTKVFFVGLPPMKNERMTADVVWFNEIFRERAEAAGATYVDIWDGFVDGDGAYSSAGPDLNGRVTKLRAGDGIHFTKAGQQLAAHYVERDLRRVLGQAPVAATPSASVPLAGGDGGRSAVSGASVSTLGPDDVVTPGEEDEVAQPEKPEFGPVLPLDQAESSPGGVLIGEGPAVPPSPGAPAPDPTVVRVLSRGEAIPSKEGRADDFRWPRTLVTSDAKPVASEVKPSGGSDQAAKLP